MRAEAKFRSRAVFWRGSYARSRAFAALLARQRKAAGQHCLGSRSRLGAQHDLRRGVAKTGPAVRCPFQLPASLIREGIELGSPIVLAAPPAGRDPASPLHAVKRRIHVGILMAELRFHAEAQRRRERQRRGLLTGFTRLTGSEGSSCESCSSRQISSLFCVSAPLREKSAT